MLIVFDCDGVLVDSERLIQEIDLRMIAELGWPITVDEIWDQHLGRSEAFVLANIERHIGRPVPVDFAAKRAQAYRSAFATRLKPVPGVRCAIQELHEQGRMTCVASSGSHEKMRLTLGCTGLFELFEGRIFSGEDVPRGKPAPDLFLQAATRMGVDPCDCLVVEDSPAGVTAARAAGMAVIGYAAQTPERLLSDTNHIITDMTDLVGALITIETACDTN